VSGRGPADRSREHPVGRAGTRRCAHGGRARRQPLPLADNASESAGQGLVRRLTHSPLDRLWEPA